MISAQVKSRQVTVSTKEKVADATIKLLQWPDDKQNVWNNIQHCQTITLTLFAWMDHQVCLRKSQGMDIGHQVRIQAKRGHSIGWYPLHTEYLTLLVHIHYLIFQPPANTWKVPVKTIEKKYITDVITQQNLLLVNLEWNSPTMFFFLSKVQKIVKKLQKMRKWIPLLSWLLKCQSYPIQKIAGNIWKKL